MPAELLSYCCGRCCRYNILLNALKILFPNLQNKPHSLTRFDTETTSGKGIDSPVESLADRQTIMSEASSSPTSSQPDCENQSLVKQGSPYEQIGRFFLGLKPSRSGICAVELQEGTPVTYVSHCTAQEKDSRVERLMQASHTNLLGLREVFINADNVYFLYDRWGMALEELQQLFPVFQPGEVEVATVCKGVLSLARGDNN